MKIGKKLFSVFLSIAMLMSMLGTSALAVIDTDIPDSTKTYTVTFDPGDGSGSMEPVTVTKVIGGDTTYTLPVCTFTPPAGKAFVGWEHPRETGRAISPTGRPITLTGNTTITARWGTPITAIDYTLSGYTVGGKIVDVKATPDADDASKVQYLDSYSRNQGCFICTDAAALTGDFTSAVSGDSTDTFAAGTTYYLVVNLYAAPFCSLVDLTAASVKLGEQSADALLPLYGDGSVAAYAVFQLDPPSDGGSAPVSTSITAVDLTLSGYDRGEKISDITVTTSTTGITLDGGYGTQYFIALDANGSDRPEDDATFAAATDYYLGIFLTANDGYSLTDLTAANVKLGGKAAEALTPYGGGALHIAVFKLDWLNADPANAYTITFDANGGSGSMDPVLVPSGVLTGYPLPACTLTPPAGKAFLAWEVNGYQYPVGSKIPVVGNTVIKALWGTSVTALNFTLSGHAIGEKLADITVTPDTVSAPLLGQYEYVICTSADVLKGNYDSIVDADSEAVFEANTDYYLVVSLDAKEDCSFSDLTAADVKLNGTRSAEVLKNYGMYATAFFKLTLLDDGKIPVTALNFTLSGYTVGEKLADIKVTPDTATDPLLAFYKNEYDTNYVICTSSDVLNGKFDSAVGADSEAVFAANTDYYLVVSLAAKDGCSFSELEKANVKLNGTKSADVLSKSSTSATAVFKLDRLSNGTALTPITSASLMLVGYNYGSRVTGTMVAADTETSTKLNTGSYGDSGFMISTGFDATKNQLTNVIEDDQVTFAADTPYYIAIVLNAKSGYTFAGLTANNVTLNGKTPNALVALGSDGAMMVAFFRMDSLSDGNTPVTALNFTLSGHAVGKKITGIKVTPDTAANTVLDRYSDQYFNSYAIYTDAELGADALVDKNSDALFMGDTDYYLALYLVAKEGYSFTGLTAANVKLGTQSAYALIAPENEDDDVWLVAFKLSALAPDTYTVTFDPGDGSGSMEAVSVPVASGGETKWLAPVCTFTPPEGKAFARWAVIAEDDTFLSYAFGNAETTLTGNVTLAADWGTPVTAASYSLSGYTLGAKVKDITLTRNSTTPADALTALSGYGSSYMIGTGFVESKLLLSGPIMEDTAAFAADTDYCLVIYISAKDGRSLAGLTKENVTLNGENPDKLVPYGDGGFMKIAVFELAPLSNGPTSITAVNYSISGYTAGARITDLTVSTSTTGIKTPASRGIDYYVGTGPLLTDIVTDENATFAKNTDYYLTIRVRPEDGYSIDQLTQAGIRLGSIAPSSYSNSQVVFKLNTLVEGFHIHTYDNDVWSKDGTNHWHECTAADCPNKAGSKKDTAIHVYDNDQDVDCGICGYERPYYTVTFAPGDGSGTMKSVKVPIASGGNTNYILPSCTFTPPEGSVFSGWKLPYPDIGVVSAGVVRPLTGDTTFTAMWGTPIEAVNFTLNNYAFGSKVTGITLTKDVVALVPTAYNKGHLIGTGYTAATGALTGGITDTNATLAADTDYYLSVTLTTTSAYSLKNLKRENIKLNGVAAEAVYPFGDGSIQMGVIFKLPRLTDPAQPAYVTECIANYVSGYSLLLVYTNGSGSFSFDNKAMYDVSDAGYKYNGTTSYTHVYAALVNGQIGDTAARLREDTAVTAITLNCDTLDVNNSGTVDLRDAVATVAVYNTNATYMTDHLPIVLKADVNHDKRVDASDFNKIKAQYLNS